MYYLVFFSVTYFTSTRLQKNTRPTCIFLVKLSKEFGINQTYSTSSPLRVKNTAHYLTFCVLLVLVGYDDKESIKKFF